MSAVDLDTADAVLSLLDMEGCAINMTGLVQLLPNHPEPEIKRLTNDLYMQGKICRVQIMGPKGRYYGFYALAVRTARGISAQLPETPPPAEPLTTDEVVKILGRGGWHPEPEVVEPVGPIQVERRAPDRRRLTVLEVVKRWRLPFTLGRVVEIIAGARKGGMSRDDAALAIKMIREHVRGD